jgi:hypothetical protein
VKLKAAAATFVLSFMLICIILTAYAAGPDQGEQTGERVDPSWHHFTLMATGAASDPHNGHITVSLSLTGTFDGKLKTVLHLDVQGGSVTLSKYGTFPVTKSHGIWIQGKHYIELTLKITGKYGGNMVVWDLDGETGKLKGNSLQVSLDSERVILPTSPRVILRDLDLTVTLKLS